MHFSISSVTWKFLWTRVTGGSFLTPLAKGSTGPLGAFSEDDDWGASLAALDSFSRISTSSFKRKFKNSCASYKEPWRHILVKRSGCFGATIKTNSFLK